MIAVLSGLVRAGALQVRRTLAARVTRRHQRPRRACAIAILCPIARAARRPRGGGNGHGDRAPIVIAPVSRTARCVTRLAACSPRRRSARLALAPLLVLLALLLGGCLGGLVRDSGARAVARAPGAVWRTPLTSEHPHWLLRGADGWRAAQEVGYGSLNGIDAAVVVHAVRFASVEDADAAFDLLTPEYLFRSFPDEIGAPPVPDRLRPEAEAARTMAFSYFVAFAPGIPSPFVARLVKARSGRVVILVASLGQSDEQIANGVTVAAETAGRLGEGR